MVYCDSRISSVEIKVELDIFNPHDVRRAFWDLRSGRAPFELQCGALCLQDAGVTSKKPKRRTAVVGAVVMVAGEAF
jgi:hypothetical protein